jgi:hypothetical protein
MLPCAALVLLVSARPPAAQPPAPAAPDLVGTWTLASMEQGADGGQPAAVQNPRGLLVFDAAGHVYEAVTRAGQAQQPRTQTLPLTDAQLRFLNFAGFWGGYRRDGPRVTYRPEGAVSPQAMGAEFSRSIAFENGRLVVTSSPGEPHTLGVTRWRWERVPVVENLTPTYRRVVGFWQHVVEKRVNVKTGVAQSETRRAPSIIVYSPSGFVGVHFPPLNRKRFAADLPTDEEARAALMGYVGYFGALTVYPDMVFHHVMSGLSLSGTILKRPLELSGSEVTIKFPPNPGQDVTTWVTLRRMSGDADMVPRAAGR